MGVSVLARDAVRSRAIPEWARWKESVQSYTVGLEEEVMLLKPGDLSFAQGSDRVIDLLSPRLTPHTSRETHAGILELKTGAHHDARSAVAELWALHALVASSAIPEPTFLWWDVRLQPRLGTVEVRVMDTQSTVAEVMALVALLQSLARLEVEESPPYEPTSDEVLAENRFLAARDGLDARLIEAASRRLIPARTLLSHLIEQCRPHAFALGRSREFATLEWQAEMNGAGRQRRWVAEGRDLPWVLRVQTQQFTEPLDEN